MTNYNPDSQYQVSTACDDVYSDFIEQALVADGKHKVNEKVPSLSNRIGLGSNLTTYEVPFDSLLHDLDIRL